MQSYRERQGKVQRKARKVQRKARKGTEKDRARKGTEKDREKGEANGEGELCLTS